MKIRITDLMDNYSGDGLKLESPESFLQSKSETGLRAESSASKRWVHRVALITASLVLMVTALSAGFMVLSRTASGNALEEGSPASALETFGSEASPERNPPAMIAQDSNVEEAEDSALEQNESWSNSTVLTSAYYPVELEVPAKYAEEILVDIPFSETEYDLYYSNAVFTFCDKSSGTYNMTGLVWCIIATPKEAFQSPNNTDENCIYMFNQTLLGTDEDYVYELIHPDPSGQYNPSDAGNTQSYYKHIGAGQSMVEQFIRHNAIDSDGTWRERYEKCTLRILQENMEN